MQTHPPKNFTTLLEPGLPGIRLLLLTFLGLFVLATASFAQVNVSGEVSGIWDDSLYIVVGDISIEQNASLTIMPGVIVKFDGNFWFDVYGLLQAQGSIGEPITIYGDNLWHGIYFHPESSSNSILENCTIRSAFVGIECERAFLTIRYCWIDARSIGIKCVQSSPVITNNHLIRVTGYDCKAIHLQADSSPLITNNVLIEAASDVGNATGIWIDQSTAIIDNNWIEVVSPNNRAIGVYANRSDKVIIDRNIIRLRSINEMRDVWLIYTIAQVTRNDMFLMSTSQIGIIVHVDQGSLAQITNNIMYGNGISTGDRTDAGGTIDTELSGYNNYYQHASNHVGEWDGYRDVIADPAFETHSRNREECDYDLIIHHVDDDQDNVIDFLSPCIDHGSPIYNDDFIHGTPSDIGKYPASYDPSQLKVTTSDQIPVSYNVIRSYPNPFNRNTTFSFNLALPGQANVVVFDLSGRQLATLWNGHLGGGVNHLNWSAEGLAAGEYLVRFELPGSTQTHRVHYLP